MRFKALEIGQTFRHGESLTICIKTDSNGYKVVGEPDKHICYVSKAARNYNVIPESEPPSMIAAAKRDARWYVLADMDANIKTDMDRAGSGTVREIQRQNLLDGLDVLRAEMTTNPENLDQVLHDLIEIVRELV